MIRSEVISCTKAFESNLYEFIFDHLLFFILRVLCSKGKLMQIKRSSLGASHLLILIVVHIACQFSLLVSILYYLFIHHLC